MSSPRDDLTRLVACGCETHVLKIVCTGGCAQLAIDDAMATSNALTTVHTSTDVQRSHPVDKLLSVSKLHVSPKAAELGQHLHVGGAGGAL